MMNHEHLQVLRKAVETWGVRNQIEMLQEECTELALAARKYTRSETCQTYKNFIDEVADVAIMIVQMDIAFGDTFFPHVMERIEFKINRLEERLSKRSFEPLSSESHDTPQ